MQETETEAGEDNCTRKIEQILPGTAYAGILPVCVAEEQPEDAQRNRQHAERHQGDVVGLHDIAYHLVGIHQIIDGDKVEAHCEFLPEHNLADEDKHCTDDVEQAKCNGGHLPPPVPDRRHEQFDAEADKDDCHEGIGNAGHHSPVFVGNVIETYDIYSQSHEQAFD